MRQWKKEWSSKENKLKLQMQALELLLRLEKRHILGRSDVEQRRNQTCSFSQYQVTLA